MDHVVPSARVFDALRRRRRATRAQLPKPQAALFLHFTHTHFCHSVTFLHRPESATSTTHAGRTRMRTRAKLGEAKEMFFITSNDASIVACDVRGAARGVAQIERYILRHVIGELTVIKSN